MADAPMGGSEALRFAADRMLGRLARWACILRRAGGVGRPPRWLRIPGHAVAYGPHLGGRTLVSCARREGRMILTRDTRLRRDRDLPPHVFLESDHFREQLRQVASTVHLSSDGMLRRCLDCNRALDEVPREH